MVSVSNVTSVEIGGLTPGTTYYFSVTSFDSMGDESDLSNEVSDMVPTLAPTTITSVNLAGGQFGLTVAGVSDKQYVVEASTDLINWIAVQTNTAPFTFIDTNTASFSHRYFRVVDSVPVITPTPIASSFLSGGLFGLTVAGISGDQYEVEASTDLIHWIAVQTNTAPFTFIDTNTTSFSRRFFRVIDLSL